MALELISGLGPENNDAKLYEPSAPFGTWPTVTDVDGVGPPQGTRWWKPTSTASVVVRDVAITPKTYQWVVARAIRHEGTLPGYQSQALRFLLEDGKELVIGWHDQGDGTIRARLEYPLNTSIGIGATVFNLSTNYGILCLLDGTNITLTINGVQELQVAFTHKIASQKMIAQSWKAAGPACFTYFRGVVVVQSNSLADAPPTTNVWMDHSNTGGTGNSDWATENAWDDEVSCGVGSAGTYTDTILDASDQVDVTHYWCAPASSSDKQMSDLEDPSVPAGAVLLGVINRLSMGANPMAKTVKTWSRLHDGFALEKENTNVAADSGKQHVWPIAPNGGAWDATSFAVLRAGLRTDPGNGAQVRCYGMEIEWYAIEAPTAAGQPAWKRHQQGGMARSGVQSIGRGF